MEILEHFYIEKIKTLQLYDTVHTGNCSLLSNTYGRSSLGEFSDIEEILEVTGMSKDEVEKCQVCFLKESE